MYTRILIRVGICGYTSTDVRPYTPTHRSYIHVGVHTRLYMSKCTSIHSCSVLGVCACVFLGGLSGAALHAEAQPANVGHGLGGDSSVPTLYILKTVPFMLSVLLVGSHEKN